MKHNPEFKEVPNCTTTTTPTPLSATQKVNWQFSLYGTRGITLDELKSFALKLAQENDRLAKEVETARLLIGQKVAEIEELNKDKERLDWLETRPINIENFSRQTIDCAMKESTNNT